MCTPENDNMSKKYMKTNNLGQKPQDAGGYSAKRKQ